MIENALEASTGRPGRITGQQSVGGGCISSAQTVEMDDGRKYFVKHNASPLPGMFPREAEGLTALADAGAIRIPKPIVTGGDDNGETPFIVMEHIESARPTSNFSETFGRQFAQLHQRAQSERYGFDSDNYLGSTPQPNNWNSDWVDFWRQERLGCQLTLLRQRGRSDRALEQKIEHMMDRLEEFIGQPDEPACLLHGDLWGGNYLADENGQPVLIDPAVYYGRREADLAMTMLFGGFDSRFYAAYQEVWPLADGSEVRLDIYKLWHLLNHLAIFGGSYYGSSMSILQHYV
jgi:protein-ribulosamine 3-kinase